MHDILRETPIFQLILEEGREEGRLEERLVTLRQSIIIIVQARFPALEQLAKEQVSISEKTEVLAALIASLSVALDEQEARSLLLSIQS